MKAVLARMTLPLVLLLAVAAGGTTGAQGLDRSTEDRPDEQLGPQIHVVYATAADGPDRSWDTSGLLARSVSTWNGWFRQHADGASLRIDTVGGEPDISFVRLGRTGEQVVTSDPYYSIAGELQARGFDDPSKVYAVYYDGRSGWTSNGPCGLGSPPVAIYYVAECGGPEAAALRPDAWELGMLHEVLHALGVVPACAPHYSGGHVNEDNRDLIYSGGRAGPIDWPNLTLDPGRDDYFGTSIPGCPDLAESDFLTTRPFYRLTVTANAGGDVSTLDGVCRQGEPCSFVVRGGTEVTLTASPDSGYRLARWSGACGRAPTCRLSIAANTSVAATFRPNLHRLRLSVSGRGLVRISPGKKTCSGRRTCVLDLAAGTRVTLSPVPARGARFVRWRGGGCTGARSCVVRLDSDRTLTAAFSSGR